VNAPPHHDDWQELAALYALGILPPEQAAAFEQHLGRGCPTCQRELEAFTATAAHLGYAAAPARPGPEVRRRLLAAIAAAPARRDWTIVRAAEGVWETAGMAGLRRKPLFRDGAARRLTALVRLEAAARYPPHRHADTEELYLLDGDLVVEGQALRAGDYSAAVAGTFHHDIASVGGCTFLLLASEADEVCEAWAGGGPQTGLVFVLASEGTWQDGPAEGVAIKALLADPARRTLTALVRMRAGARLPRHRHLTAEQFYMLEGDGHVAGHVLGPGDYYHTAAGTVHEVTYTEGGCVFLLFASRVELLC
jgi:putative transcriptional regulator